MEARRIFAAPLTPPALQKALKAGAKTQIPPKTIGLSFPHLRCGEIAQWLFCWPPCLSEACEHSFRRTASAPIFSGQF